MIGKIILGIITLYLLIALYFGVIRKRKIFKKLGKIIIFLIVIIILAWIVFTYLFPIK